MNLIACLMQQVKILHLTLIAFVSLQQKGTVSLKYNIPIKFGQNYPLIQQIRIKEVIYGKTVIIGSPATMKWDQGHKT